MQVGPLWGNIVPTNIPVSFPWLLVSHLHSNRFCRRWKRHKVPFRWATTFSRPANRSKLPGRLFEGGRLYVFLLVFKSIVVPFYSLHGELSIKRQQERARTIISTPHRPLSKMLLPAEKTKPINDSLILHFFFILFYNRDFIVTKSFTNMIATMLQK